MIINSSQISMEASTGHKDVSRTSSGKILSRNHSGLKDQHFNPDFSILKNSPLPAFLDICPFCHDRIHEYA